MKEIELPNLAIQRTRVDGKAEMIMSQNQCPRLIMYLCFCVVGCSALAAEPASSSVDFKNDLIPVFTKLGCNSGACHGAAAGRGGFNLSLYGGDPTADYDSLVRQFQGRRVNVHAPESSLVLLKPTESIAHEGGYLIEEEQESYRLLLDWIREGAELKSSKELSRIELSPSRYLAKSVGESFEIRATAFYSDGSQRDVTDWTVFSPEDESAVSIDPEQATAVINRRGRHIVVARYLTEVVPIECIVPMGERKSNPNAAPTNFIDEEINKTLHTLGLPVSARADDHELVRRLTLDLTGRLPAQMSSSFGDDLIDELLSSDEFVDYWTMKFAKLFRVKPSGGRDPNQGAKASFQYHQWLAEQIRSDTGYDKIASQVLLSSGDTNEVGPANFYRTVRGAKAQAEFVSELFMGSRLRCANCHNHPLDKWTQDDYHGLAAIFAKLDIGKEFVKEQPRGEVIHPKTSEPAQQRIPGEVYVDPNEANGFGRKAFTEWLTGPENPYFAKAFVNRVWNDLMGRGLVSPVDDFRATNPPTHPQLLEKLSNEFVESGYSLKHVIRSIVSTDAYARSARTTSENKADDRFYSHRLKSTLAPEVLADAIADVLRVSERYGDLPSGTRAVNIVNPKTPSRSLDVLGRCSREESCEGSEGAMGGLPQKLHLFNGGLLNDRIGADKGRLGELLDSGTKPSEIIGTFYEAALNRPLTAGEQEFWQRKLAELPNEERVSLLEDFVWSLVTCEEFVTNH